MSTSNDPFDAPASSSGIQWDDLNGTLLLIEVKGHKTGITTAYGTVDAVEADVYALDGDLAGTPAGTFDDTLIFPKVLQGQLKSRIGGKVLGRLGQGEKKPGQSPPWKLAEATEKDKAIGRQFLADREAVAAPPF